MRIIINKNIFLSILAGILIALSFPNFFIPFVFVFGFIIWFSLIYKNNYKKTAVYSFLTGFSFSLLSYYWIIKAVNYYGGVNIYLSLFLLALFSIFYSVLYFVSFGLILKFLFKRYNLKALILVPFIWVIIEISREYFPFTGFPWNLAGYMISYIQPLDKLSSFFSIYGLSFLAISISSLLFFSYIKKDLLSLTTGVLVPIILYISLGFFKSDDNFNKKYKIAILQGNITEDLKQNKDFSDYITNVYIKLFKEASNYNPDLIILPESAVPFFYFSESNIKDKFFKEIKNIKIPFIIGLDNWVYKNEKPYLYNSVFLFDENHNLIDYYNKMKLVPFGEYVPFPFKVFSKMFPYLEGWDFSFGKEIKTLNYRNFKIAPLVCFEATFPNLVSKFSENANLLVNLSNDAWFGKTSAPFQHFEMSRIRAVENGKYLVRATNTGISAIISPDGKAKLSKLFERQILIGEVALINKKTFWLKYKIFILLTFLVIFFVIILKLEIDLRRQR